MLKLQGRCPCRVNRNLNYDYWLYSPKVDFCKRLNEDNFKWDETKAAKYLKDHVVAFQQATQVFNDHFTVEWINERENYGEERINRRGICEAVILYVIDTERGERFRIISARRADRQEQAYYYRENAC